MARCRSWCYDRYVTPAGHGISWLLLTRLGRARSFLLSFSFYVQRFSALYYLRLFHGTRLGTSSLGYPSWLGVGSNIGMTGTKFAGMVHDSTHLLGYYSI